MACVMVLTAAAAGAVEFGFESSVEDWTSVSDAQGVSNFGAADGVLGFDYVTPTSPFDPMIISPAVSIPGARDNWLILNVNLTAAAGAGAQMFQLFFATPTQGFSEAQSRTFAVTPNLGWQTVIVDLAEAQSGRDPWPATVSRFRLDPGSNPTYLVGYRFELDSIAITYDTDGDNIPDDSELLYWGNLDAADATSDYDDDLIPDRVEIQFGLNPLVDEGVSLPVGHGLWAAVLAGTLIAAAAFVTRRRTA